ncbi:hypothetical protein ACFX15_014224 [Malus domestica]
MTAFNTVVQEVQGILNSKQIDLLKKTRFWPLLKAFYKRSMSKDDIVKSDLDLKKDGESFQPSNQVNQLWETKYQNNLQISDEAQSEIDDCDDVEDEDYDYGNYDDARDENFDSAKNEDGEEDEGDKDKKVDEDKNSKDENISK